MSKAERKHDNRQGKEFTKATRLETFERQGHLCIGNCGRPCEEAHHNKPIFYGGTNESHNCVGACPPCHTVLNKEALQRGKSTEQVLRERDIPFAISERRVSGIRITSRVLIPIRDARRPSLSPR